MSGTFSPSRRGPSFLTMALHLGSSKADFDSFLRLTFGIEHNTFSVEDAKAAARSHGGSWDDCCESWLSCGSSLLSVVCRFGVAPVWRLRQEVCIARRDGTGRCGQGIWLPRRRVWMVPASGRASQAARPKAPW